MKIRRALVSVSDKTGLIPFAKSLSKQKVEIISTGGTLKALQAEGIPAVAVDSVTGFPEIMEGRVKTLHPKIHGALLYRRDKKSHEDQAREHGIEAIDLVVVNLYPFEKVTQDPSVALETAIENIDIGGPSMLRSAAKNSDAVTVVCDPADYETVLNEMKKGQGEVSAETRRRLALKVFEKTAAYDNAIAAYLAGRSVPPGESVLPADIRETHQKARDLRYGENPHQQAALYIRKGAALPAHFNQLHGKELSFNNLLDIEATIDILSEFSEPAACVVKHSNPCGVAEDKDVTEAVRLAIECDMMSAFGGIVAVNRPCTAKTAQEALDMLKFFEVFVAPSFDAAAMKLLKTRKNLRVIETGTFPVPQNPFDIRFLRSGGFLYQQADAPISRQEAELKKNLKVVTKTTLTETEIDDLIFAFKCVKIVKSNAIVITQGRRTVGIGAGQMSRVDAVELACRKGGYMTDGGYLASDAFFPMPDSIEVAHDRKIRAIIQPGGSIKDAEVIAACDQFGIAMVFTGQRHFRH